MQQTHRQRILWAMGLSFLVAVGLLVTKCIAWLYTDSSAALADTLESVVHVASTALVVWCARVATAPPDAEHPYGHGRVEFLSAGFEGGAVALAALGIAGSAVNGIVNGNPPHELGLGAILLTGSALINLLLGWWLIRQGRRTGSALLTADGHHVLSDVWTTVGVVAGLLSMLAIPDPTWRIGIDVTIAVAIALWLLFVAWRMLKTAIAGLLDTADPLMLQNAVNALNAVRSPHWRDIHGLRLRRDGSTVHGELHLVVPSTWSVADAHDASETVEKTIIQGLGLPGVIVVHLDHDAAEPYLHLSKEVAPFTVQQVTRPE